MIFRNKLSKLDINSLDIPQLLCNNKTVLNTPINFKNVDLNQIDINKLFEILKNIETQQLYLNQISNKRLTSKITVNTVSNRRYGELEERRIS